MPARFQVTVHKDSLNLSDDAWDKMTSELIGKPVMNGVKMIGKITKIISKNHECLTYEAVLE